MKRIFLSLVLLAVVGLAGDAQAQRGRLCSTTYGELALMCGASGDTPGLFILTDGSTVAIGAAVTGSGGNTVVAYCSNATTCTVAADDSPISGATAITGTTSATFTIDSDGSPGAAILDTAGAGAITIGSGDVVTVSVDADTGLTFVENGDAIFNSADSTFEFNIDEDSTVVIVGGDTTDANTPTTFASAGTGTLLVDPTGAGAVQIGSADVLSITAVVDNDVQIHNGATGNVTLDFRDYADTDDDDMAHAIITVNCPVTGTGAEACDMDFGIVTGGAAAATIIHLDGDEGDDGSENTATFGNANTEVVTITTDDTGDGTDLVLPANGVDTSELNGANVCGVLFHSRIDPTEAGGTDDFMSFADHAGSTTEGNEDDFLVNGALLTFHSLRCDIDVAPGAGQDAWRIVVRDDGGDTAVTCDIDEAAVSCADSSNSAAVAAASLVNFDVTSEVSGDADPTAAADLFCTVCMGP